MDYDNPAGPATMDVMAHKLEIEEEDRTPQDVPDWMLRRAIDQHGD